MLIRLEGIVLELTESVDESGFGHQMVSYNEQFFFILYDKYLDT